MSEQNPLSQKLSVLRYWRNIELFLPFDLDEVIDKNESSSQSAIVRLTTDEIKPLPWEQPEAYQLDPQREYAYDFFVAPFLKSQILHKLKTRFPTIEREIAPDTREFNGLSCLARLTIAHQGVLITEDKSVSTLPWALDAITRNEPLNLERFDAYCQTAAISQALTLTDTLPENQETAGPSHKEILTHSKLLKLTQAYTQDLSITFFPDNIFGLLVIHPLWKRISSSSQANSSQDVKETNLSDEEREEEERTRGSSSESNNRSLLDVLRRKRKCDILNSFYLRDLERVYQDLVEGQSTLVTEYLRYQPSNPERIDIRTPQAENWVQKWTLSKLKAPGRWPAPAEREQSEHQQMVLNRYFHDDCCLFGVNGPPGTGKTSLLRDLIAELVVKRAWALSELQKPADGFELTGFVSAIIGGRRYRYRQLIPALCGYEIVVCSNNNSAVENISRELPKMTSLGTEFSDIRYLSELAKMFQTTIYEANSSSSNQPQQNLWGMPSVALGNARNRRRFRKAAFLKTESETPEEKQSRLAQAQVLTLLEWRGHTSQRAISFFKARKQFKSLYQTWQSLPDSITTEEVNRIRSRLFQAALQIHEAWLREVPQFEKECYALSSLIKNPQSVSEQEAKSLWQLFFMIIPVVSSTLASVERMFAGLRAGSIGHVVIDEAGQATPQSVIGIIHRAKRVLCLGDQRQLRPVVLTPDALERHFGSQLPPEFRYLACVLSSSAQSLVDASSQVGTWLGSKQCHSSAQLWISLPLCVHRRCAEPMFSFSNELAYDGIMQSVVPAVLPHPLLGESAWFQVAGTATVKQWVPEQGSFCLTVVEALLADQLEVPDVFIITPFREVRSRLTTMLSSSLRKRGHSLEFTREIRKRIGTVHSFQGKEAEIVLLVLGCDTSTGRAADWAGEEPNLLNVAVTRARKYLYVIGDANVWHNRGYFSDLEKGLPKRTGV